MNLIVAFRNLTNALKNQNKICAVVTVKFILWSKNVKSATQEEAILCAVLYGRERWPLIYRKVHRMGKFEMKMMSRMFGPNINGVKDGGQRDSMRICAIVAAYMYFTSTIITFLYILEVLYFYQCIYGFIPVR